MCDRFVQNHFSFFKNVCKIGEGGVADVYCCSTSDADRVVGHSKDCAQKIAIKVSRDSNSEKYLLFESKIMERLQKRWPLKRSIIPVVKFYEVRDEREILGMELLGKSLFSIFTEDCKCKFSLKTIFMIMDQCLQILHHCHKNNVYHLDIKDQNILLGLGAKRKKLYLIDFGLSACIDELGGIDYASSIHIPYLSESYGIEGCLAQQRRKLCRDKDLFDMIKMALFFLDPQEFGMNEIDLCSASVAMTEASEVQYRTILSKYLPELWNLFTYIIHSGPITTLNYRKMRNILRQGAFKRGIVYDWKFDWEK